MISSKCSSSYQVNFKRAVTLGEAVNQITHWLEELLIFQVFYEFFFACGPVLRKECLLGGG